MKILINACVLLAFAFSAYFFFDKTYAKNKSVEDVQKYASEVKLYAQQVQERLDYKIIGDQVDRKGQKIIEIDKEYPDKARMPEILKKHYEELQKEKAVLEKKLEVLEKK